MKIKHLICMAAVLMMGAGITQAENLLSIDFESPTYTTGDVINQDGWQETVAAEGRDAYIGTGIGVNTSQVYFGNPSTTVGTARATRPHDFAFTSSDTLEITLWGCLECDTVNNYIGNLAISPMWEETKNYHAFARGDFGMYYYNSTKDNPQLWFRDGDRNQHWGDTLVSGHWYEIKAVVDFSTLCSDNTTYGSFTMYYRDLTNGDTTFTMDSNIQDKDLYLVPNGDGEFKSLGIVATLAPSPSSWNQHQYIDNISLSKVPEPSTMALLGCGLIGLLAYAWRKRK